jgi:urea transport system permease protein
MRFVATLLMLVCLSVAAMAQDAGTLVNALAAGSFKDREASVTALAASGIDATVPVLEALVAGNLHMRKTDQKVFITTAKGEVLVLTDPQGLVAAGEAAKSDFDKIKVNNALRKMVQNTLGGLTLFSADLDVRRKAALNILKSGDPTALPALDKAIAVEKETTIKACL